MKYVSIDLECTGLDEESCQIIEIGAVIDDSLYPEIPIKSLPFNRLGIAFCCIGVGTLYPCFSIAFSS